MNLIDWIMRTLIRTLRVPGTVVDCTAALATAMDRAAMKSGEVRRSGSLDLLVALLDDPLCGFTKVLTDNHIDVSALQRAAKNSVCDKRHQDRDCLAAFNDSYEIVPLTSMDGVLESGGKILGKQTARTCHMCFGLTKRPTLESAIVMGRFGFTHTIALGLAGSYADYKDPV